MQTRFYSVTGGENAEILVAKAIAYTAQTTYKGFEASAADGEVGIFDANTLAVLTTALTAGQKYFIAQKRDVVAGVVGLTGMKTTTTLSYDSTRTRRVAYVAPVKQVTTIVITTTGYTPVKGDDWELAIIETTPGNDPYPTYAYDSSIGDVSSSGNITTAALALQKIVARINSTTDLVHKDDGSPATATYTDNTGGVYTIVLTANYFQEHFRIAMRGPLALYGVVTYTTPFVEGSGFSDHITALERQGWVYEGVGTLFPQEGTTPVDFGLPTAYTVNGLTYNIYHLDPLKTSKEPMPQGIHHYYGHLYIITPVPVGGSAGVRATSSPDLAIGTVLGFTLTP